MEELETPVPDFVKGFNEGYIIAQHLPDLATQLSRAALDNERGNGFKAGREESVAEREKQRTPDWLPLDFTQPSREPEGPTPERGFEPER